MKYNIHDLTIMVMLYWGHTHLDTLIIHNDHILLGMSVMVIVQASLHPYSGEGTPIFWHDREVLWWRPAFLRFSIWLVPYFMSELNLIDLLFLQTKAVCLSITFVQEIIGHKIGLICPYICKNSHLKHLVSIFSLIFKTIYPLFIVHRSFWPILIKC